MENKLYIGSISTVVPRGCGIATYNKDQMDSMIKDSRVQDWGLYSIVTDKNPKGLSLPYERLEARHIEFEIDQYDPKSFEEAGNHAVYLAKQLEMSGIKSGFFLQHEFGLYGRDHKKDDSSVGLLKKLNQNNIPSVTILHTVETRLKENINEERHKTKVMKGIFEYTDKAVCISHSAIPMLMNKYSAPRGKLIHIPHGVPERYIPESRNELKEKYGFAGRKVFTSLGHISTGKGLEYAIEGFAEVLKGPNKNKNPVYFIAGATHEEVKKQDGEVYWEDRVKQARERKIPGAIIDKNDKITDLSGNPIENLNGKNIVFLNRSLTDDEIPEIMQMSNVGIVVNLNEEQYSSGPGSQWIGRSRITIGTESVFFKGLEDEGVGLLVPFRDSQAIADRMNHVLELSPNGINDLECLASDMGSTRTWPIIAQAKLNLMEKLIQHRAA